MSNAWPEKVKEIAIKIVIIALSLVLIVSIIFTAHSLYKNYKIYQQTLIEKEIHRQKLQAMKNEYDYNSERIKQISEDIDFAKNVAREKIKMSEDGEIVFHFEQN